MTAQKACFVIVCFFFSSLSWGQLSPGDLVQQHAHLEGMSNCTKCHTIGAKISNDKCLTCHQEIKSRIDKKKGYHSSPKVYKKSCTICHSDHHGRTYKIIHFNKDEFDHNVTGYTLQGKHALKQCNDCHTQSNVTDPVLKKKKTTYLGLSTECITCHEDYHQKTLSANCSSCHNFDAFKPASRFNHETTRFPLKGKHVEVECIKCHTRTTVNGKNFQQFNGVKFNNCSNCHIDVHNKQFGQKCSDCHVEQSFKVIKKIGNFDHDLTDFKLRGQHITVPCNSCHKGNLTSPVKHTLCADCHADFHEGEFRLKEGAKDCSECHSVNGFTPSSFTVEKHNKGPFKLVGAHESTKCSLCHKTTGKWRFRNIGSKCSDCHNDIHREYLDARFYPEANCLKCHVPDAWNMITFDHTVTNFELKGQHKVQSCRSCHLKGSDNISAIRFTGLPSECIQCHEDEHQGQFEVESKTDCSKCHFPDSWLTLLFNHDNARFKLDGKHQNIACINCHPVIESGKQPYVLYKTGKIRCADCH